MNDLKVHHDQCDQIGRYIGLWAIFQSNLFQIHLTGLQTLHFKLYRLLTKDSILSCSISCFPPLALVVHNGVNICYDKT